MTTKLKYVGLFLLLLFLNVGCNSAPSETEPLSEQEASPATEAASDSALPDIGPLQVGYVPVLTFAPFFVAYEKGYFAEQGLEVELQSFRAGPQMMTPLSTGQLDVGQGATAAALFNAFQQGLELKIVAGGPVSQDQGRASMPLLVRKTLVDGGEVSGVADLAGRKVALNVKGGTAEYLLAQALESGGLTIADIELVILPIPEFKTAFENGAVDAAPVAYPLAGQFLQEQIAAPLLVPDAPEGTFQFGGLFFGKRLLGSAHQETAVRFLTAYLKAEREIYQNPTIQDDALAEIIQQYTDLPLPAIKNSPLPTPVDGQIETELLTAMQDYFITHGYTEYSEPLPPEAMIDENYRAAAMERLEAAP